MTSSTRSWVIAVAAAFAVTVVGVTALYVQSRFVAADIAQTLIDEATLTDARYRLSRPHYANAAAWYHVRQSLLKVDDPVERRRRFDGFVSVCGESYRHGVRAELAAQRDREPYATLLAQLGGPPEVEPIEMHDLADSIDTMPLDPDVIGGAVTLVKQLTDAELNPYDPVDRLRAEASDYLAVACMKRLLESGDASHDLVRRYIDKRIGTAEYHGNELRALRARLDPPDDNVR